MHILNEANTVHVVLNVVCVYGSIQSMQEIGLTVGPVIQAISHENSLRSICSYHQHGRLHWYRE